MPQIYVIIGPPADALTKDILIALKPKLKGAVEEGFGLTGLGDVAFTAVSAFDTEGEADVQIEIRYTAGEDEYGRGEPFDPSTEEQAKLAEIIKLAFDMFLKGYELQLSLSVWCKPYYKSVFKTWKE